MARKQRSDGRVYEELKRLVITLRMRPGFHIVEEEVAARLGVSRTPVKEALIALESDGFVERDPGSGYTVRRLSLKEVRSIFEVRLLIEPETARTAAQRVTESQIAALRKIACVNPPDDPDGLDKFVSAGVEFHTAIAALTGNAVLLDIVRNLNERVIHLGHISVVPAPRPGDVVREHMDICDCLARGAGDEAADAVRTHIVRASKSVLESMIESGDLYIESDRMK